ncbi:MAG: hypothetical protein P8049_10655 [Gemmatimonadota bacterium]
MECRRLTLSNLRSAALIALVFAAGPALAQEGGTGQPAAPPPDPASSFILRDVTIVDVVRGELHAGRTVTVENGWIRSIGDDGASSPSPSDRRVIDGAGGYLVPGLWDMHAHPLPTTGEGGGWWEPDPETSFALLVANGVTGVRDMWGSLEVAARLARERRSRDRRWPRVLTPGGIIDGPVPYYPSLIAVGSSDEARSAVDSLSAGGADFIKVYSSLPEDLLWVITERAREVGLDVAGHVPAAVPARTASEAGMKSFEHLYGVLEGCSSIEGRLLADNVAFLDARAAGRNSTRDDRLWFERLLGTQAARAVGPPDVAGAHPDRPGRCISPPRSRRRRGSTPRLRGSPGKGLLGAGQLRRDPELRRNRLGVAPAAVRPGPTGRPHDGGSGRSDPRR